MTRYWRDVPMPPRIARLPRDKRGFPCPFVSEWDSGIVDDDGHRWKATVSPVFGRYLSSCVDTIGVGTPKLGNLCAPTAIRCVDRRICATCGTRVNGKIAFLGGQRLHEEGYSEPGVHLQCALYAGQVCPGLVTKERGQVWVSVTGGYQMDQVRAVGKDDDGEIVEQIFREYDTGWKALGSHSILTGALARPIGGTHVPLEEFLLSHGAEARAAAWKMMT